VKGFKNEIMITQYTPIEKQIEFLESKINQYLDVVKVNPKGENAVTWLNNIQGWNREIIELQKSVGKTF
jgi:hypothetical protein